MSGLKWKKVGVIDVGSNSVRLMLAEGDKAVYKKIIVTRLAEGLCGKSVLKADAIERTAKAIFTLVEDARLDGASDIFAFATASVRQSENGKAFTDRVKELCGVEVEVIDGETEAEIGYLGALNGRDGGIIDIGGASTEIIAVINGSPVYLKSLDIGSVRIFNACGQDRALAEKFIKDKIKEYGEIPKLSYCGIGGTATSLASLIQGLEPYDPTKTDGYVLTKIAVKEIAEKLYATPVEERKKLKGLQRERAEVIAGGALLLSVIMETQNLDYITVSEKDNLEGYLIKKGENYGQKN